MHAIGAHVSAAGGIDKAVERAAAIGCDAVQVFSGSPRVWARPKLESINTDKVFSKQKELNVRSIITHSLYLVNLCSDKSELCQKSAEALIFDLHFDAYVKGQGVVVHVGSHQGRGWAAVRDQVAQSISDILQKTPSDSQFLIENSAGQNGKVGSDLAEVKWLMDQVDSPRLGWCLDTCHAFAAGYALDPNAANSAIAAITEHDLFETLGCIHVNDSRDPFASGRDRHANLGEGLIPHQELAAFLNHENLQSKTLILEVPGEEKQGPDAINVQRLKKLVHQE